MATVPTVKIVDSRNEDDYIIINESNYDPTVDVLWEGEDKPASAAGGKVEAVTRELPLSALTRVDLIPRLELAGGKLEDVEGTGSKGGVKNTDIADAITRLEAAKAAEEAEAEKAATE